jgi:hypothetical protein
MNLDDLTSFHSFFNRLGQLQRVTLATQDRLDDRQTQAEIAPALYGNWRACP